MFLPEAARIRPHREEWASSVVTPSNKAINIDRHGMSSPLPFLSWLECRIRLICINKLKTIVFHWYSYSVQKGGILLRENRDSNGFSDWLDRKFWPWLFIFSKPFLEILFWNWSFFVSIHFANYSPMHRVIRACNLRIPRTLMQREIRQLAPSLNILNSYTTAASKVKTDTITVSTPIHPLITKYKGQLEKKGPALWQSYQDLKADPHDLLQNLKREDFLKLRADLWSSKRWGTEDHILQVLNDMKRLGHAWDIHEYNEYFMAKLFQAQYADVLTMYNGEFQQQKPPIKLSIGSFNVILATYIQLGNMDEAIQLIKDANKKHDVIPDIRDFDRTMYRCMPKNKQVSQIAKELIAQHSFSSIKVLNANLMHLFQQKRIDDVKWIYQQQKDNVLDITTYNTLIKGYSEARLTRDATLTYKDMEHHGVKPNSYICASLLAIYAHTRDVVSAEQIVRETIMGGHKPDEILYNQLIKVYFKARQSRKAFQAFQEVEKDPTLQVNDVILNTMINGLVINKEFHVAGLLYRQMIQSQFKPDMITFNTMLKGYIKADDMVSAGGIISDMFKIGLEPDTVTYTTLIDSVFKSKSPQTAEEMMELISQMGMTPNIYTFNAVINGWIQADRMDQAEKTLELMKSPAYRLWPTVHTYTNLIQGYVEQMDLGKAMATFQALMRSGTQPDRATFNFMIVGFLNHDRLNDAYACLEHMISMNLSPTKDTWKLILSECCLRKNWTVGHKVVQMLDQSGFVIKSDSLRRPYTIVKSHCT